MSQQPAQFPQLEITSKTGAERFHRNGQPLDLTVLGFWRWAASDLVSNAMRGILAEYIVASALGIAEGSRGEWDAFDLVTKSGIKIEVKSAAYLQTWYQTRLSRISFRIQPTRKWEASTNQQAAELRRQADIYVFCVLHHQDKETLDPLNLAQWWFYILRASILNEKSATQKTFGLNELLRLNPLAISYEGIADGIEELTR